MRDLYNDRGQMAVDFLIGISLLIFGIIFALNFVNATVDVFAFDSPENAIEVNNVADKLYYSQDGVLNITDFNTTHEDRIDSHDFYNITFTNISNPSDVHRYGQDIPDTGDMSVARRLVMEHNSSDMYVMEVKVW